MEIPDRLSVVGFCTLGSIIPSESLFFFSFLKGLCVCFFCLSARPAALGGSDGGWPVAAAERRGGGARESVHAKGTLGVSGLLA